MRYGDQKWGGRAFGSGGGEVSWNFTDFRDNFNELQFGIVQRPFQKRVQEAFDLWEAVLDIDFVEVAPSARADIQLGFAEIDGPGGTLGQTITRFAGRQLQRASVIMDVDEDWTAVADFTGGRRGDPDNFFAVFAHELGHALGIDHLRNPGTLMHAFTSDVLTLTRRDVEAGVSLYGPNEGAGAPGAQILVGLDGADRLSGGRGRDSLFGEGGADRLRGGGGDDKLVGGRGADRLDGGRGDDRAKGGAGADRLDGGRDDDVLKGGGGGDRLDGGRGADLLRGGRGADEFVLRPGTGRDRVADFQDGLDRIRVDRDLDVTVEAVGVGVEVRLEGGDLLRLRDIDPDDISAADFVFV